MKNFEFHGKKVFSMFLLRLLISFLFFYFTLLIYRHFNLEIRGIDLIFLRYAILGTLILYLITEYKKVLKVMFFNFSYLKGQISVIEKPTIKESKKVIIPNLSPDRKYIKPILIALFFFLLGVRITMWSLYSQGEPFNILTENFNQFEFLDKKDGELLHKEVITGKFKAQENNLGIVSIRFDTYNRTNTDYINFKIKEENGKWDYHKEYYTGQFQNNQFFQFGFPKVNDSKNKDYIFELVSARGKNGDAVGLSKIEPKLQVKYEYTVGNFFSKPLDFLNFVFKKIINLIYTSNYIFNLLIYFLPLCFYLLFFIFNFKHGIPKAVSITTVFLLVLIDTFFLKNNDFNYLTLILIWLFLSIKFKLSGRLSVLFGLVFLLVCPFFMLTNNELFAEKVSIWAYLFIIAGTILIMREERRLRGKQNKD